MNELYVLARRVLLDALEALADHREAIVLVGAQAVSCALLAGEFLEALDLERTGSGH